MLEAPHWFPLWDPRRAGGDDEMGRAAVLDCAYMHQGGRQHNTQGGEFSPDTSWQLFLKKSLMFRHFHLSLTLERCLEAVTSLCDSRARACEAALYFTGFLRADNCWESSLCHKPGSTSRESVDFNA